MARFYARDPWGAHRDNLHTAMIVDQMARVFGGQNRPLKLRPYLLRSPEEARADNLAEAIERLRGLAVPLKEHKRRRKAAKTRRGAK